MRCYYRRAGLRHAWQVGHMYRRTGLPDDSISLANDIEDLGSVDLFKFSMTFMSASQNSVECIHLHGFELNTRHSGAGYDATMYAVIFSEAQLDDALRRAWNQDSGSGYLAFVAWCKKQAKNHASELRQAAAEYLKLQGAKT